MISKSIRISNQVTGELLVARGYHPSKGARMETATPLEVELGVFDQHRREWSEAHLGKFVVIQGRTIIPSFFDAYEDAFLAGVHQFGTAQDFLVKQIWKTEPVYFVA
jgi:hypothetical protein